MNKLLLIAFVFLATGLSGQTLYDFGDFAIESYPDDLIVIYDSLEGTLTVGIEPTVCEESELILTDTIYNEGDFVQCQWIENNGGVYVPYESSLFQRYNHQWVHPAKPTFGSDIIIDDLTYVTPEQCPSNTISEYERICRRCLRWEYYKEVQTYKEIPESESLFERLKAKIK